MFDLDLKFRWFGVAGFEISNSNAHLQFDPYLTRIPFHKQWVGPIFSDVERVNEQIKVSDAIFITHAHFDHYLDVPTIAQNTKCKIYGSNNTCQLSKVLGIEEDRIIPIVSGTEIDQDLFKIIVHQANHGMAPGFSPGKLNTTLKPPLTAKQYAMDECFSFEVIFEEIKLMTYPKSTDEHHVDILLLNPLFLMNPLNDRLIIQLKPKVIIPIHWENLYKNISDPIAPMMYPPYIKFLRQFNLPEFIRSMESTYNFLKVFVPDRLKEYSIADILSD
jgi:L-ascorbate metabolism protein UlaG (beta-lactamase superfamily)